MDVSGQPHAPAALTPRERVQVPTGQEAWWAPVSVTTRRGREKSLSAGNRTPDRPSRNLGSPYPYVKYKRKIRIWELPSQKMGINASKNRWNLS